MPRRQPSSLFLVIPPSGLEVKIRLFPDGQAKPVIPPLRERDIAKRHRVIDGVQVHDGNRTPQNPINLPGAGPRVVDVMPLFFVRFTACKGPVCENSSAMPLNLMVPCYSPFPWKEMPPSDLNPRLPVEIEVDQRIRQAGSIHGSQDAKGPAQLGVLNSEYAGARI